MSTDTYENKQDFVNEFSLKMEESGHPRIFGQILGWLLVCNPQEQSFHDLMENLDISKASVSNVTRILLELGLIERVRVTGERQMYFRLMNGALAEFLDRQIKHIRDTTIILEKGLRLIKDDSTTDSKRIEKAARFYAFIAGELPELVSRFNSKEE